MNEIAEMGHLWVIIFSGFTTYYVVDLSSRKNTFVQGIRYTVKSARQKPWEYSGNLEGITSLLAIRNDGCSHNYSSACDGALHDDGDNNEE